MNSLTEILQELYELHVNLLDTAKKKQLILISGEINPLLSILAEESKLIKKIKEADSKRQTLLGEEAYKLSLTQLIQQQPDSKQKEDWKVIHSQLQNVFEELGKLNESNQQLIEQSLTYTQYMIEQMLPVTDSTGIYDKAAGTKDIKKDVRLFDSQA
jgi:flagellar biosynthesis/type III secretory pathway chaperone